MSQNPKSALKNNGTDFTTTTHNDTYPYISPSQFNLKNRAVLITGASKGIGRATAISYAAAGTSQIAIAARSGMEGLEDEMEAAAREAGRTPPQVWKLKLDVTSEESVAAASREVEREFGRLDILVNNAGYLEPFVPITESKTEEWWKVWEVSCWLFDGV